ncbi:unnamed protein product [marine sediment metagenome]|uniref:Uncharacterized protein n=1 Tax=marine sediment metagenome TaxID=412755 RepID=X1D0L4_9ZZZZ
MFLMMSECGIEQCPDGRGGLTLQLGGGSICSKPMFITDEAMPASECDLS